jgi:hypothetical protein
MSMDTPEKVNTGKSEKTLPILGLSGFSGFHCFLFYQYSLFQRGQILTGFSRFDILEWTKP